LRSIPQNGAPYGPPHVCPVLSTEVANFRYSLKPLRELYGHTLAAKFGPLALKAVRQRWADAGISRKLINRRVGRIKRMFKRAVAEELVPATVFHALKTSRGWSRVGRRPRSARRHKTAYRGRPRAVLIGAKAQLILGEFRKPDPWAFLFSPREAVEALHRERAEKRVTRRYPRRGRSSRKERPKRRPAEAYTIRSYGYAVARACKKAGVPVWDPYRLRHTFGAEVRRGFGLEATQVLLGHSRADATQVYAEANRERGKEVVGQIG
jgi:integrase